MSQDRYKPASLQPVDGVDVLELRPGDSWPELHGFVRKGVYRGVSVEGEGALRIADLFRKLPEGEQMRCHVPRYGVRFRRGERVLAEFSLCFKCNNAFGYVKDDEASFVFDGQKEPSQSLLAAVKDVMATHS